MKVVVDLAGQTTGEEVLLRFGEVFELGGPNGNHKCTAGAGWGINWNALNDSLSDLDTGGIWGSSRIFSFPLEVDVINCGQFKQGDPASFQILQEILDDTIVFYTKYGKSLRVTYG